ncbi:hypothetical protein EVC30_021 [Rhizobium phage RHph_Y1_11]|nr:hypothetical protein EVC30_021 [Rhizobium phage RHph_Y1_11]
MIQSILDPVKHERLIKDIHGFAEDARVPITMIQQSCAIYCTDEELDWLKNFKRHSENNRYGLVVMGLGDPTMEMMAMAGALVRNFIRARFITMTTFLDQDADPDLLDITCLFVANFFNHEAKSETIQQWKLPAIYDLLVRRASSGKQTVLHVTDYNKMRVAYGAAISNHLLATYPAVQIKGNLE